MVRSAHSLMDRASVFGTEGWGFDSLWAHKYPTFKKCGEKTLVLSPNTGRLAQLVEQFPLKE